MQVAAPQQERRRRCHQQQRPQVVDGLAPVNHRLGVALEHRNAGPSRQRPDGQHHEKHQPPRVEPDKPQIDGDQGKENRKEPQPDQRAKAGAGYGESVSPAPFLRLEGESQHRVAVAVDQPGAQPLQGAKGDNLHQALRHDNHRAGQGDDHGADKEHFGMPKAVAQPRPQKHRAAQHHQVDDDDQRGFRFIDPERAGDAGHRQRNRQAGKLHQQLPGGHRHQHLAAFRRVQDRLVVGYHARHRKPLRN